ncbi:MAG: 16S rRNA (guanine(527)-N(7))-methyltransferase RsmG [Synergistetes bacterium]|nr:16S rRNA (guanine(527)-N(7))-methyltransferase RsmG [Synergistota bacterium]MDW8191762.1 16S rRNA (guanine(527)-N(7))-methyltransferase RsmG [Synergistota bacterium]
MIEVFKEEGFFLTPQEEKKFYRYLELILSAPFNITSISLRDPKAIAYRHFIDSIQIVKFLDLSSLNSLLDVGTGGGFPGIPIKILKPHLELLLLESVEKKISFLKEVVLELSLPNVKILLGRAEELGRQKQFRESVDIVVSRAVASLNVLLELTIPFLKIGGLLVAYKGKRVFEEIDEAQNALNLLNCELEKVEEYYIKAIDFKGYLVFIRKRGETPAKYPRKTGIPFKRPL